MTPEANIRIIDVESLVRGSLCRRALLITLAAHVETMVSSTSLDMGVDESLQARLE